MEIISLIPPQTSRGLNTSFGYDKMALAPKWF